MEKRLIQFVFALIVIFIIWDVWQPFWRFDLNDSVDSTNDEKIIFEITKGSSARTVAQNLEEQNLIVNDKSFLRTLKAEETDGNLRYGNFLLSQSMTLREVITILTTQGTGEMALTFIEGWTIDDMDTYISELGLITAGEFRQCTFNCDFEYDFLEGESSMEGYLFPDTYFIDSSTFSVELLIDEMLNNFDQRVTEEMHAEIEAQGRNIHDVIVVASMIEKEVRTEKDISLIGGIIWKRLDNDWTLGIDATLLYLDPDGELTSEDLALESPYNTRINTGLPPTAISNPGLASIEGAVYPEESDYWFYLTTLDTGEVIYSITNEEHENNKAIYLQ